MGIYAGVDGVQRKIEQLPVGVNGVVRASYGFNGLNGIRRQFFGPLEDIVRVEVRPSRIDVTEIDSSGNWGDTIYQGTELSEASKYGSVTITSNSIAVSTNGSVKLKFLRVSGYVYAVFENGREQHLDFLSDVFAKYNAAMSFPIGYSISVGGSSYTTGRYIAYLSESLRNTYVDEYASGTKTFSSITSNWFEIGSAVTSGSGTSTTRMSFSSIVIDGRTVPVTVASQLT